MFLISWVTFIDAVVPSRERAKMLTNNESNNSNNNNDNNNNR